MTDRDLAVKTVFAEHRENWRCRPPNPSRHLSAPFGVELIATPWLKNGLAADDHYQVPDPKCDLITSQKARHASFDVALAFVRLRRHTGACLRVGTKMKMNHSRNNGQ